MNKFELKNCPFCGSDAEIITQEGTSFCSVKVKCSKCDAMISKLFSLSVEESIIAEAKKNLAESWNKRV